jgi:hypothetical protein
MKDNHEPISRNTPSATTLATKTTKQKARDEPGALEMQVSSILGQWVGSKLSKMK